MRRAIPIISLCLVGVPAWADLGDYCLEAMKKGDKAGAQKIADVILFSNTPMSSDRAKTSAECLRAVTGLEYIYVDETAKFEPAAGYEQREAERRRKLAAQRQKDREEAAKQRAEKAAEAAAAAERQARTDQMMVEAAQRAAERERAVSERLALACENMFRRDPDATMTNRLCFDVFWRAGLPD